MWFLYGYSFVGFLSIAFTIWMIVYCLRNDPDRYVWMWVIFLFGPLGALIYFLVRYVPTRSFKTAPFVSKFLRGKELKQLEWKCRQIGNAHQWVEYGEALRDVGRWSEANQAFREAVTRDESSLPARWGAATCAHHDGRFDEARDHLEAILEQDSRYKFGDPSLLLGKTYLELGQTDSARATLAEHVIAHRTPEAVFLLGKLQADNGDAEEARETLQSLVDDLENAPRAIVRKSMFWRSRAKKLMRSL